MGVASCSGVPASPGLVEASQASTFSVYLPLAQARRGASGEGERQTARRASFPSLAPSSAGSELHKPEALRYGSLASALPDRSA
jgi:hypothetical protein